jgi:hypothetical protein
MAAIYLHNHKDFPDLLRIIDEEEGIEAGLIEKDYWIMHGLYGLKQQGYTFQLKGGTSLSKGYGLIHRFSEDIDLHIEPPAEWAINQNPNNSSRKNIEKKKEYYDFLAKEIAVPDMTAGRDIAFDDAVKYNSGGIRLQYKTITNPVAGLKQGILLEAGYAIVTPNTPVNISSWAYERAVSSGVKDLIDNRAMEISCYDPRYTFVEKLQTIATKYRKEMTTGAVETNYMRQYYDIYCLLKDGRIQAFIGTEEYYKVKEDRFPVADFEIPVNKNEAFLLTNKKIRDDFKRRYEISKNLYYKGQPSFDEVMERIREWVDRL